MSTNAEFEQFVREAEPRLRRAFAGSLGTERASEALAEAFAWAWENRARLAEFENPVGYLFRVGQSKSRLRKRPQLPPPDPTRMPHVEPALVEGLMTLTDKQRTAVWLVHACSWSHAEVGEALDISSSTVATHVQRGLAALRAHLGEVSDV